MVDRPAARSLTPYLVGPTSEVYGGGADTVLIPTFRQTLERALLYAEQAARRGGTSLILLLAGQPFPDVQAFDHMAEIGAFLIPVTDLEEGWDDDERLILQVHRGMEEASRSSGEPPKLSGGAQAKYSSNVSELSPEERLAFLRAFYNSSPPHDG